MSYLKNSLAGDEVLIATFHQHWVVWIQTWGIIGLGAAFLVGLLHQLLVVGGEQPSTLTLIFGVGALVFEPWAIYEILSIKSREFGLTNRRVIEKNGIIAVRTSEIKLTAAETVTINKTVAGRLMGFGDVKITARGNSEAVMKNISHAMEAKKAIENEIKNGQGDQAVKED